MIFIKIKLIGGAILAVGIYVLVDPKFTQFQNVANVNVLSVSGLDLTKF